MLSHLLLLGLLFHVAGDDLASNVKPEAETELGGLLPDRPGFTTPTSVVGPGVLQFESGYVLESAREDGVRVRIFSGFQTLARFGLSRRLEVRLSTNGYCWRAEPNRDLRDPGDSGISAKFRLMDQRRVWPELAVVGGMSMPVRGSAFTTGGRDPAFTLALYKDLPRKFNITGNINAASVTDAGGRYHASGASVSVGYPLWKGISGYGELYRTTICRGAGSASVTDAGFSRTLGNNYQIDIEAGHTVAGVRPSWFAGIGLVIRAPHRLLFR